MALDARRVAAHGMLVLSRLAVVASTLLRVVLVLAPRAKNARRSTARLVLELPGLAERAAGAGWQVLELTPCTGDAHGGASFVLKLACVALLAGTRLEVVFVQANRAANARGATPGMVLELAKAARDAEALLRFVLEFACRAFHARRVASWQRLELPQHAVVAETLRRLVLELTHRTVVARRLPFSRLELPGKAVDAHTRVVLVLVFTDSALDARRAAANVALVLPRQAAHTGTLLSVVLELAPRTKDARRIASFAALELAHLTVSTFTCCSVILEFTNSAIFTLRLSLHRLKLSGKALDAHAGTWFVLVFASRTQNARRPTSNFSLVLPRQAVHTRTLLCLILILSRGAFHARRIASHLTLELSPFAALTLARPSVVLELSG